jgi:hypothetical protein
MQFSADINYSLMYINALMYFNFYINKTTLIVSKKFTLVLLQKCQNWLK